MYHQFKDVIKKNLSEPKQCKFTENGKFTKYRILKIPLKFNVYKIDVKRKSDGVKNPHFRMELFDGKDKCVCLAYEPHVEVCSEKFKEGQNYSTDVDTFYVLHRKLNYPSNSTVWFDLFINSTNGIQQLNTADTGSTFIQPPSEVAYVSLREFKQLTESRKRPKRSFYKIRNVTLSCRVQRFIGCPKCKRKVTTKVNPEFRLIYSCTEDTCDAQTVPRTQLFRLSNIVLSEGRVELHGLIAFHDVAQNIIGIPPTEYKSDLEYEYKIHLNKTRKYTAKIKVSFDKRFGPSFIIDELIPMQSFPENVEDRPKASSALGNASGKYDRHECKPNTSAFVCSDDSSDDETYKPPNFNPRKKASNKNARKAYDCSQRRHLSYKISRNFKGAALIINNVKFRGKMDRIGAEVDRKSITTLLERLKFNISYSENVESRKLDEILMKFKSHCLANEVEAICVVLMSYGQYDNVLMCDNVVLNIWEHLIYKFGDVNCPGLFEIPKMFFIECSNHNETSAIRNYSNQDIANAIVFQSSIPGSILTHSESLGSPFIQRLYRIFAQYATNTELIEMLEMVEQKIKNLTTENIKIPRITAINFGNFYFSAQS